MKKLINYFTDGITSQTLKTIGAEIETQFVDKNGQAIQTHTSQHMLRWLSQHGWNITAYKGDLITTLVDHEGNSIFYELGRHNIEISTIASTETSILSIAKRCLTQLYSAAEKFGAEPYFGPLLNSDEDLLIIPDKRDSIWLELDGRDALAPLARTSSVQFTISVAPKKALDILNKFGAHITTFLKDFPQDVVWKTYIAQSSASYLPHRYGGPLLFDSLLDYCRSLTHHNVVQGTKLVPYRDVSDLCIPLYLRSIWWHFRLKRYINDLCIEIRPMARRTDNQLNNQLERVLHILRG